MVGEATVERPATPEVKRASNALMLHIAHGKFDNTKTSNLDKNPQEISHTSFNALQYHHDSARKKQQEQQYDQMRKTAEADPEFHGQLTPEMMRHLHFITWAKVESIRIGAMFRQQKNSPEGQEALKNALGKLHIVIDENVDATNLPDQFYNTSSNTNGEPGEFYKEFCIGNTNKKLVDTLSEQEMIVLKDFLIDTLGSKTAYDALIATKQTQDAIEQHHDFSTESSSLPIHEYGILEFFGKGVSAPAETESTVPEALPEATKIEGGYTMSHPEHPDRNDDASFIDKAHLRGGIFDGAGGYAGGDKASRAAMEAIREVMDKFPLQGDYPINPIREQFLDAFALANDRVKASGGMTTGAVWQIARGAQDGIEPRLLVANIGDSRVWIRHKDGTITQVTRDGSQLRNLHRKALRDIPTNSHDSRFQEERDGEIKNYEDLQRVLDNAKGLGDFSGNPLLEATWHTRNQTNLLGNDEFKDGFEFFESPIEDGDTIFATTDGVHDNLTLEQIAEIAKNTADSDKLSKRLVEQARAVADTRGTPNQQFRAKPDDITAIAYTVDFAGSAQTDHADQVNTPAVEQKTDAPTPDKIVELANQAYWYMRKKSQEPLPVAAPGAIAFAASGNEALMGAMSSIRQSESDFGEHFYGHGIAKGSTRDQLQALINILQGQEAKGTSTTVSLGSSNTNYPVYSDGGFVLIGPKDKPLLRDNNTFDVGMVAVNEQFYDAIPTLESWFPHVKFVKAIDAPAVLEKS